MTATMIITAVLTVLGMLFMFASLIGLAKLPDFFTRLHVQGVGDTLGAFLILAGMMVAVHGGLMSVKILLIFIIIVLTNPIGTNLMMIAAINKEDYLGYSSGMAAEPEEEEVKEIKPEPEEEPEKPQTEEEPEKPQTEEEPEKPQTEEEPEKPQTEEEQEEPHTEEEPEEPQKDIEPADEKKPDSQKKSSGKGGKKKRRNKPSMKMNKAELIREAEKRGIEVPEKATKREILDLIYGSRE